MGSAERALIRPIVPARYFDDGSPLGLRLQGDRLRVAPCLPADWNAFTVHYRYLETVSHIKVHQKSAPDGARDRRPPSQHRWRRPSRQGVPTRFPGASDLYNRAERRIESEHVSGTRTAKHALLLRRQTTRSTARILRRQKSGFQFSLRRQAQPSAVTRGSVQSLALHSRQNLPAEVNP